jgi:membrane-bound lytic murein transglycosylase D
MASRVRHGLGGWWRGGGATGAVLLAALLVPRAGAASEVFPVPAGVSPAVRFWIDAFSRYGNQDVLIHDRVEPGVVYEVVHDVPPGDDAPIRARVREVADRLTQEALRGPNAHVLFGVPTIEFDPMLRLRTQRGMRETFEQGLTAERLFRGPVRRALAAEGLPPDLAALPLVESSYHPGAVSSAGAIGLWQLTADVAGQYAGSGGVAGLQRDPFRASVTAARYLHDLYDQFESWPLAITAYNRGPSGVEQARRTAGSDDLGVILARYDGPGFGFASKSYYAEFLAARHVMRHASEYFPDLTPGRLVAYRVKRGDTLARVARRHGVSIPSIRVTNGIRSALLRPGQVLLIRL